MIVTAHSTPEEVRTPSNLEAIAKGVRRESQSRKNSFPSGDALTMDRPFFSRLRVRLLLLVLLAVTPALGMTIYTDLLLRRQAEAGANREALRVARQASANQTQLIEGAHVLLVALARLREVRPGDSVACNALFGDLGKQYPRYTGLGVMTPDGNLFCSSLPLTKPVNVADRAYFQRVLKTRAFALGDYQIGRISGKASIAAAHPVLDAAGRVQAVVTVALDLAWLNLLAAEARLPEGTTLTVIDSTGLIVARHPDPQKWVGRSVPEAPVVKAILGQGREGTVEAAGVDGVRRLYAFTPLGSPTQTGRVYVSVGFPRLWPSPKSTACWTATSLDLRSSSCWGSQQPGWSATGLSYAR